VHEVAEIVGRRRAVRLIEEQFSLELWDGDR